MRKDLAAEYSAQYTCPITSGIFLRICTEHAYEEYQKGKPLKNITPFWRMIDSKAPVAKKLTFGYTFVHEQRLKGWFVDNEVVIHCSTIILNHTVKFSG
jgi:hypothetical protein